MGQMGSWCKPTERTQRENRKQTIWWAKQNHRDLVRSHLDRLGKGYTLTPPQTQASFFSLYHSLPFERWCWPNTPRWVPRCFGRHGWFPCSLPTLCSQLERWKIFREFGGQEMVDKPWTSVKSKEKFGWTFLCLRHFLLPPRSFETWCTGFHSYTCVTVTLSFSSQLWLGFLPQQHSAAYPGQAEGCLSGLEKL